MSIGLSKTVFRSCLLLTTTVRGKSLWTRKFMGQRNRGTKRSRNFKSQVPQPGIEHVPLAMEAWSLNHWTTVEVPGQT